ncbi:glycoside hydrolase 43 family protein [Danxiaibacter flavus]|uniref:Glycoside hydrolase 43 family protein n=1 Tax=Danxiaibacter flavus TaxID=3049108 RepID=A0ABV3ZAF1_9BACT|nr:glycoside hydrolase 43 family protein [Chitinophagaceae bacterium DXS]
MKNILVIICCLLITICSVGQQQVEWGKWKIWGDQGNGIYVNPIIPSDYSDIDCIRVSNDYYAISSTFQFSPGMTILHSRDLVNWEISGNIIDDLTQISNELSWTHMNRYGKGVWAGTLRYHNERFYLFFGTPDEGYFMTSAPTVKGPWEPLTQLLSEAGWDDCTTMWDDDGQACFIGTHFSDGYKTYMFKMSVDGKSIDRKSAVLINSGDGREANKLIKINGWYYLVFSEYKAGLGRYVMAKRSRKMMGPYYEEKQLALSNREAMEPNQGGIIQGMDNKWYFLTHHGTGDWSGRIVSLLPVTWVDDWPIIGEVLPGSIGRMKWSGAMPFIDKKKLNINRTDDFGDGKLSPQWQWNYQPRQEMFSLSVRPGWLRLKAYTPLKVNKLMTAGNTLTQRCFRKQDNDVIVKMDITNMADGQKNGLCHFSSQHAALGIVKEGKNSYLEYRKNDSITRGPQVHSPFIWLKSQWGLDGNSRFFYSLDGDNFIAFGESYQLVWGNYRGDRLGIYCFNDNNEKGFVDIDYFHYQ